MVSGAIVQALELRCLLSAAFDVTHLTGLRQDPNFADVDGSGIGIAVLDTGVYAQNPDLQTNVVAWYNAVTDPISTPLASDSVNRAFDNAGHGSHVAGISASTNPDIGVAYGADIISVKVLPDPGEPVLGGDPIVRGLRWVQLHAQDLNIRVVNLSVGTAANINTITDAQSRTQIARTIHNLEDLGITVVAASGNSYAQYLTPGAAFPAAVSTISVANTWADTGQPEDFDAAFGELGDRYGAVDQSAAPDRFSSTSQRSTLPNQIAAPGQDIYSTWNGFSGGGGDGLHKIISGTSMAAPFISGVVALMQDAAFTYGGTYLSDPNRIRQILQNTADTITDSNVLDNQRYDTQTGATSPLPETGLTFKRVNVQKAIQRVFDIVTAGNPSPPDPDNAIDTNSIRTKATVVPTLNATRKFSYRGNVGFDGQVNVGDNDIDLFRITLESRGNLTVALAFPDDFAFPVLATIRLFNTAGTEIARADADPATFDYPTLTTDPTAPLTTGVYYVGISSANNFNYNIVTGADATDSIGQGDYAMNISLANPDPNGVAAGAQDVDLTNPTDALPDPLGSGRQVTVSKFSGILGSDRPIIGSADRVVVDADVDMFRVLATDTGKLDIVTQAQGVYGSKAANTYLKVYDENLNLIATNDDISGTNTDSKLSISTTAGSTYFVAVTVLANAGFDPSDPYNSRVAGSTPTDKNYDILMWQDNGDVDGTAVAANMLATGTTVNASIGHDGSITVGNGAAPNKDVDWYVVTAPADGLLQLRATGGSGFSPSLSLWDFDAASGQSSQIDQETQTDATLGLEVKKDQAVYVAVTGAGNGNFDFYAVASGVGGDVGAYALSANMVPDADAASLNNDSVENGTPTPITLDQSVSGSIGRDGTVVRGDGDIDLYLFKPTSDITVRIRTVATSETDADTVLRLFDSKGRQIVANDNASAAGKSSRLAATLRKGQIYYIGVSGAGPASMAYNPLNGQGGGPGSTGRYGLVVDTLPAGSASLTFSGKNVARYRDQDGHVVTLRMIGAGTGQLEIDGADPSSFELNIEDTGTDSVLVVGGRTTFGNVKIDGPMKSIKAPKITLAGTLDVEGAISSIQLGGAAAGSTITTFLAENLTIGGDSAANVEISGDLGFCKIAGDLTGGTWNLAGTVRGLTARDATSAWTANIGGEAGDIRLRSLSGTFNAGSIKTLAVSRDISHAAVHTQLTGIDTLSARDLVSADIRSADDIRRLIVRSASDSIIFAGVSDSVTTLPTASEAFTAPATISQLTVKSGPFSNTLVAARTIGAASIRGIDSDNSGKTFGLATTDLNSVVVPRALRWKSGDDPTNLQPIGDFHVNILKTSVSNPPPARG